LPRTAREPTADHPITIAPTPGDVVVEVEGVVVARSTSALTLSEGSYAPVQYLPIADVDPAVLQPSEHTSYCPYKGDAGYFSVAVPGRDPAVDVIWTYEDPYPAVAEIAGHVAFYANRPGVEVRIAEPAEPRSSRSG
jgi:uncharacterized protein (DUF427 family)